MLEASPPKKYVLCRRPQDGHWEVIKIKSKTPSAIGIVDYHKFMQEHGLHPIELTQFFKIGFHEVGKIQEHGGWIDLHAQEAILKLIGLSDVRTRHAFCTFLSEQSGSDGSRNIPFKSVESDHDLKRQD